MDLFRKASAFLGLGEELSGKGNTPDALSFESTNAPCTHCKVFTTDYTETIKKLRAEGEVYLKILYERVDEWPGLPGLDSSYRAGCHLCGLPLYLYRSLKVDLFDVSPSAVAMATSPR
jgi:hypothetical protein